MPESDKKNTDETQPLPDLRPKANPKGGTPSIPIPPPVKVGILPYIEQDNLYK